MARLAYTSILVALVATCASAQAQQQGGGSAAQIMPSVPSNAETITHWYKQNVYDPNDNKIGDVKDLILEKGGKINAAIVGVGGFLGAGEKDVAVPFDQLQLKEKNGDRYLVMNATKEALEKAPGYTYDRTKGVWLPAKQPT